jgi:AraC-like DNA-binding protein
MVVTSTESIEITRPSTVIDHTHAATHMLVMLSGEIVEDGRAYRTGDIRLSSPADRHFLRFVRPSRCLIIETNDWSEFVGSRRVLHAPATVARLQRTSADRAIDLVALADLHASVSEHQPPEWLRELEVRRVEGRFVRWPGIDALARRAGVSREHLGRSYQRHFGTSISAALRARRLREGFDAVTHSSRSLAEVAAASGFADQSHMTRQFSAWIGLTPGALRRSTRRITTIQDTTGAGRM